MTIKTAIIIQVLLSIGLLTACEGGELSRHAHHHSHADGATAIPHSAHSEIGTLSLAKNIPSSSTTMLGQIESVSVPALPPVGIWPRLGSVEIKGWACQTEVNSSLDVTIKVGTGSRPEPTSIIRVTATEAREDLKGVCKTVHNQHGFVARLSLAQWGATAGKNVFAFSSPKIGTSEFVLTDSGRLAIPSLNLSGKVIGEIQSVRVEAGNLTISGYACQVGRNDPINVHIYVGNAAGGPGAVLIADTVANTTDDSNPVQVCPERQTQSYFKAILAQQPTGKPIFMNGISTQSYQKTIQTHLKVLQNGGKRIFLHGITKDSKLSMNNLLVGSGKFSVPQFKKLSEIVNGMPTNQDVTIAEGDRVLIDGNFSLGSINIRGELICPTVGGTSFTISAEEMMISGSRARLVCGDKTNPVTGKIRFQLRDSPKSKGVHVDNGGTITIQGEAKQGFARLKATAPKESTTIVVDSAQGWKVGDEIVLATTSYINSIWKKQLNPKNTKEKPIDTPAPENETRVIQAITGQTITLNRPTNYEHLGEAPKAYNAGSVSQTYDGSALVINLTRSVVFEASEAWADLKNANEPRGAHMMVMRGAFAQIDGAEFAKVGHRSKMGRYPFHWHLAGNVTGQYIRNSSIHQSLNRCVTVHGTQFATVEGNVCFEHLGHGYFLEDGNEENNIIKNNVSLAATRPAVGQELLMSDIDQSSFERWAGPAGFWISHPNNSIEGNIAVGSEGTGFWNAFVPTLYCDDYGCSQPAGGVANVFPSSSKTKSFNENTAIGNLVGFSWDGAPKGQLRKNPNNTLNDFELGMSRYAPPDVPTFSGLKALKNLSTGIYTRSNTMRFEKALLADSGSANAFFAFNNVLERSVVVGLSEFVKPYHRENSQNRGFLSWTGVRIYDGAFDGRDVLFADYPMTLQEQAGFTKDNLPTPFFHIGGNEKFPAHVQNLSFSPEPYRRAYHLGQHRHSTSIYDVDGTLTGTRESYVVPNDAFNMSDSCKPFGETTNHVTCSHKQGLIQFWYLIPTNSSIANWNFDYQVTRKGGGKDEPITNPYENKYDRKFSVIHDKGYTYEVEFKSQDLGNRFQVRSQSKEKDVRSPLIKLKNLYGKCSMVVDNASRAATQNEITNPPASALESLYYPVADGEIWISFLNSEPDIGNKSLSLFRSKELFIRCQ